MTIKGFFSRATTGLKNQAEQIRYQQNELKIGFIPGVKITRDGVIRYQGRSMSVLGATVKVESTGTVNRRMTVTRMATLGPAAMALPKKQDDRDTRLIIENAEDIFLIKVPGHATDAAHALANHITVTNKRAHADQR